MTAMALGSATITLASLAYFDADELPAFVIEKLPLPHEDLWLGALRAHVAAAAFALPACLLLLLRIRSPRARRLHRWLGRVTAAVLLLALIPSGLYLSLYAKGGLPSTVGFVASAAIVLVALAQGVRTARAGRYAAHRRCMLHIVAQLSVAVTSRAMLFLLDAADANANLAYLFSLWLPVVGSAAAVELRLSRRGPDIDRRNHEALPAAHLAPVGDRLGGPIRA
jgi:uncharacterized membrane protein